MTNGTTWQLLCVDDDAETCRQVKEYLEGESVAGDDERPQVETLTDFNAALQLLESRRFDLLILDVHLGPYEQMQQEEAGIKALEAIQLKRFVPVVFYTGLPHLVRPLGTALIQVVEKTAGPKQLLKVVKSIIATHIPTVNRALIRHLETVQRDYMWEFVAKHWEQFGDTSDRTALAYLLARRLAISLSGPGIQQLAQDLGDPTGTAVTEGTVYPMQYYLMPPVETAPLSGDVYHGQIESQADYWVLLTPSCDLVIGREKAEWVLLARCVSLTEQAEYQGWKDAPSANKQQELKSLLGNNRKYGQPERFYFLPGALVLPDLVIDLQQLMVVPRQQLSTLTRLASLDSPFAEALLTRFTRYFGRLGTPDLDLDTIISRLKLGGGE